MSDYILSCCSTADLSEEHFKKRGINYVCFHYYLDGVHYYDDLGKTMTFANFYKAMENGADTKTSQINADEFEKAFEPYLKEGKDILHVSLSSGISGVINSALIAKDILEERYPERKIYIIDSLAASSGYGLLLDKLADLRDEGMSIDDLAAWANENRLKLQHWFFSTDLTFFVKGGRISKTSGTIGGVLGICPLLNVNCEGQLIPKSRVRTKPKVIQEIVNRMKTYADKGTDYSGKVYISHSACFDTAAKVAELVEKTFPNIDGKVLINNIGTTIGSHTGPGTVALFFWGDERVD